MPQKPVNFLNKTYKTQKEFEKFVKQTIYKDIGICFDVKNRHPDKYNILIKILERHPEWNSKSLNMRTIKIINDALNVKALQIIIINDSGEVDISWRCAITGKHKSKKSELMMAMRVSVEEQIHDFRRTCGIYRCELCGDDRTLDVDHNDEKKSAFNELAYNFVEDNDDIKIPDTFGELNDGTNRSCFLEKDYIFRDKWVEYHHEHAKLRILCHKCNISRPKIKKKIVLN
tara:strand:- start:9504 stop:10193 length:690 start_codon:yes stop_codon:yes gene_type:complete